MNAHPTQVQPFPLELLITITRPHVPCSRCQITDPEILRLLYHEAKENVVDGRYPLEPAQYDMLAGLQALINHRQYDDNIHVPKYYR